MSKQINNKTQNAESDDRRSHSRVKLSHPAKLFNPKTKQFRSIKTIDASLSGILFETHRNANLHPGDQISVAIDWNKNNAIIAQEKMVDATVIRSKPVNHFASTIAVQFNFRRTQEELPLTSTIKQAA